MRPALTGLTALVLGHTLMMSLAVLAFTATDHFYLALPCVFVAGAAMTITGTGAQTLIQAAVDAPHARPGDGALRDDLPRRPGARRGAGRARRASISGCACRWRSARWCRAAFWLLTRLRHKQIAAALEDIPPHDRGRTAPARRRPSAARERLPRPHALCCALASAIRRGRLLAASAGHRLDRHRHQPRSGERPGCRALRPRPSAGRLGIWRRHPYPHFDPAGRDGRSGARLPRRRHRRAARPRLARLSVDHRRLRRPRRRLGRRDLRTAPDRRARPAPRRRRGGLARSVAAARRAGTHLPPRRHLRARPQRRSTHCAPAPRSASTSPARCSRASMSTIWRACCAASIAPAAPRRDLQCLRRRAGRAGGRDRPCRGAARARRRRRWCRSPRPRCRRWRGASRTTTSGSRTR